MLFSKTHAVMDFGTSKVSTIVSQKNKDGVEHLGLGICEYAGFKNGEWLSPEHLAETIYLSTFDAQEKSGKKIRMVDVIIPGEWCLICFAKVTVTVDDINGRIASVDIRNLIKTGKEQIAWPENYVVLNAEPVLYLLDGINKKTAPLDSFAREITAYISYTAIDKIFVIDINELLDRQGLGVNSFIPITRAISQYVAKNSIKKTNIVIDTGYFSTDIIIIENGKTIMHHNIGVGGFHITSDLMLYLNLDNNRHVAEMVKRNCSVGMDSLGLNKIMLDDYGNKINFSMDLAQDIIERRLNEIIFNVTEDAKRAGVDLNNRCGVFMSGGGISRISGARELCTKMLGQNISILSPTNPIQANVQYLSVCAGMEYTLNDNNRKNTLVNIINEKYL